MARTAVLLLLLFSGSIFARTFEGMLIDSACWDQRKTRTGCYPTHDTVNYGIVMEGKVYKLDSAGNNKVAQALKNRADRSSNPDLTPNERLTATIEGTLDDSGFLKVDTVTVQ